MRCRSSARNLFDPKFHSLGFFLYIRSTYFQENLSVFVILFFFFFTAMCQARVYSLYTFFSSKNQTSCTCFCSEVLAEIVVCQHGICSFFWTKNFPRFSEYTKTVNVKRCSANKGVLKNFANFSR